MTLFLFGALSGCGNSDNNNLIMWNFGECNLKEGERLLRMDRPDMQNLNTRINLGSCVQNYRINNIQKNSAMFSIYHHVDAIEDFRRKYKATI